MPLLTPNKIVEKGLSYSTVFYFLCRSQEHEAPFSTRREFSSNSSHPIYILLYKIYLGHLTYHITRGVDRSRPPIRTVIMSIDLFKKFYTDNHTKLISVLNYSPLCKTQSTDVTSPQRHLLTGIPQSSCISPLLLSFFA